MMGSVDFLTIIRDKRYFLPIDTDGNVLFSDECQVYASVKASFLYIESSVTFYDTVSCSGITIKEGVTVRFRADVQCDIFSSNSKVIALQQLVVKKQFIGDASLVECRDFFIFEEESRIVSEEEILEENIVSSVVVKEENHQGFCEACKRETLVHTVYGEKEHQYVSLCFSCATAAVPAEVVPVVQRQPSSWEMAHMSDDEKDFFATNGYVNFESRVPEEPFVMISQQSEDGELKYKSVLVCDPEQKYLTREETEYYRGKIAYNGGPYAWLLQGTGSAVSLYTCLALSSFFGPTLACLAWVVSIPLTWKYSKKATNMINDKFLLPHEVQVRKNLINGRRKDEELRHDTHIETI